MATFSFDLDLFGTYIVCIGKSTDCKKKLSKVGRSAASIRAGESPRDGASSVDSQSQSRSRRIAARERVAPCSINKDKITFYRRCEILFLNVVAITDCLRCKHGCLRLCNAAVPNNAKLSLTSRLRRGQCLSTVPQRGVTVSRRWISFNRTARCALAIIPRDFAPPVTHSAGVPVRVFQNSLERRSFFFTAGSFASRIFHYDRTSSTSRVLTSYHPRYNNVIVSNRMFVKKTISFATCKHLARLLSRLVIGDCRIKKAERRGKTNVKFRWWAIRITRWRRIRIVQCRIRGLLQARGKKGVSPYG